MNVGTRMPVMLATTGLAATMAAVAPAAFAVSAHFASSSGTISSTGALVVSWDERGLGNGDITYSLTADASAVYGCINGGGRHPQAANKETVSSAVSSSGTFQSKNGRVQGSMSAGPVSAGSFSCPSGQTLRLGSVSYRNIVLTDTTNDSSVSIPDVSRTLATF
jgi:hypothetical protein